MTRRLLTALILCGVSSASIAACDDGRWGYYGYGNGPYRPYTCSQYSSCGSCTPVQGCGWCSFQGGGACVGDPDDCGVNQFTWTWDPSGCSSAAASSADGGPVNDGGSRSDASQTSTNGVDSGSAVDARADGSPGDARPDR